MTTLAIRKKLMTYIADADDKKVKGLYMLVEDDISKKKKFKLTDAHMKIVESEKKKHIRGKSKSYTWQQAKDIIRGKSKM